MIDSNFIYKLSNFQILSDEYSVDDREASRLTVILRLCNSVLDNTYFQIKDSSTIFINRVQSKLFKKKIWREFTYACVM